MNFWQELTVLLCFTFSGIAIGYKLSKRGGKFWILGSFFSIVLLSLLAADRFFHFIPFVQPFTILLEGRFRFIVVAFAITIGLTAMISRLSFLYQKVFLVFVMIASLIWFSVLPFVMPLMMKARLLSLPTIIDADGVCFQSTDYTCGPAAAVTALGKLGFAAHEGELAFLSYSNPITGTFPLCLESAIQSHYGGRGLDCRYRRFNSVDELAGADLTIAVIKSSFLWDHCIVVLGVNDKYVILADPVFGKMQMARWKFEKIWRFTGITLKNNSSAHI